MQRRTGLLSPVPDVGHEQEQAHMPYHSLSIPTMLPPAPTLHPSQNQTQGPSRIYRALPPSHDPRPGTVNNAWTHAPARPFDLPVPGPLPAADFSFGAPEPGHGDAFNRAIREGGEMNPEFGQGSHACGEFGSNPEYRTNDHSPNTEYSPEFNPSSATSEFAPPNPAMWDARTRFGSMASIASDVTGVSVSSTQATSVSGGIGTAGFNGECNPEGGFDVRNGGFGDSSNNGFGGFGYGLGAGYPTGFQPDMRRASW